MNKIKLYFQQVWHSARGRRWFYLGEDDIRGQRIKVCVRCGCHFVGLNCPDNRRHIFT